MYINEINQNLIEKNIGMKISFISLYSNLIISPSNPLSFKILLGSLLFYFNNNPSGSKKPISVGES
jgi:hypothetical protein